MVLNVLTSVAQWEREAGGERTRAALMALKARGRAYGFVPLEAQDTGTRDADGRRILAPAADGLVTVARARKLRARGASLRTIASALTAEGRRTARGGRWAAQTVALLLARAATA